MKKMRILIMCSILAPIALATTQIYSMDKDHLFEIAVKKEGDAAAETYTLSYASGVYSSYDGNDLSSGKISAIKTCFQSYLRFAGYELPISNIAAICQYSIQHHEPSSYRHPDTSVPKPTEDAQRTFALYKKLFDEQQATQQHWLKKKMADFDSK